ncbi:MAG: glycoside hydrolase [Bacteroidales bacterium]|nr:glycoside hydrolase [Bacteroidales bacterium]
MKKIIAQLLLLSACIMSDAMETFPDSLFVDSHDITGLSMWGPYSKRYMGISHIADMQRGIRFDFSVMPGYYRNRQLVPHVLFESSCYPWDIDSQMKHITYRYELEWKDAVYVDVTYHLLDGSSTLVEMECVNNTDLPQNLVLNQMAYIDYPETYPKVKASCAGGTGVDSMKLHWYNAVDYRENEPASKSPQYRLVYDGWRRNEERSSWTLDGSAIGRGWGRMKGDRLLYDVNVPEGQESGVICFRYRVDKGKIARLDMHGLVEQSVELEGTGDFAFISVPYHCPAPGAVELELVSAGNTALCLDGFFAGDAEYARQLHIVSAPVQFRPEVEAGKGRNDFLLKYVDCPHYYGVAWNYPDSQVREVLNSELESFFRRRVHDHVSSRLTGDGKWHYTNVFLRPVVLQPHSGQTHYMLLCQGGREDVRRALDKFHSSPETYTSRVRGSRRPAEAGLLPGAENYQTGTRLLQASLLSNVVFPVYTQRQYIRHFTPGKNWNSLYTWDSGFIALGLLDVDPKKAFECIRAYTAGPGSESAFIHHGTPLPIQHFAYSELIGSGCGTQAMAYLYPRLKQYFDFMAGDDAWPSASMSGTGLLRTWDYFYNSGGWDDYPPQKAVHSGRGLNRSVTPAVSTAYYLRAAKIMRMAALELGLKKDVKEYDRAIARLTDALQKYSWDEESGYYAYVVHDESGNAKDIFRYRDSCNFNCGLDGVSPLVSGICTTEQENRLLGHLFSPYGLWTEYGISTVDRSAPYYREDGYWNGAVWFPHQWVIWKAMLDLGRAEEAYRIAHTALETWEKECRESYFTFEHFIISSGRGAGWHEFSGLSSPLLNWFSSYYRIGRVSTGFEIMVTGQQFSEGHSHYIADLVFDGSACAHVRSMLVCMDPGYMYEAVFNGRPVPCSIPHDGLVQISLPATNKGGQLIVRKK